MEWIIHSSGGLQSIVHFLHKTVSSMKPGKFPVLLKDALPGTKQSRKLIGASQIR